MDRNPKIYGTLIEVLSKNFSFCVPQTAYEYDISCSSHLLNCFIVRIKIEILHEKELLSFYIKRSCIFGSAFKPVSL